MKKYQKAGIAEKKKIIEDYPSFVMLMKAISMMDQLFSNERSERKKASELCAGTGCRASNEGANDSEPAPIFKELTGKYEKRLGALIT